MGLDRSYHRAAKEVAQGAADAGKAATARNKAAVKAFLREAGDAVVAEDGEAMRRFVVGAGEEGTKGLPVASKGLEEWVAGRETAALAAFKAATARFKVRLRCGRCPLLQRGRACVRAFTTNSPSISWLLDGR